MADQYSISREDAAKQINVSTRTLDRWMRSGKLKFKTRGRSVFVRTADLTKLGEKTTKKQRSAKQAESESVAPRIIVEPNKEEKVFQRLYEDATGELKQKQEKLEAASFRVGQLEAQVKASVPLLEYKQREDELQKETSGLKDQLHVLKLKSSILLVGFAVAAVIAIALGVGLLR